MIYCGSAGYLEIEKRKYIADLASGIKETYSTIDRSRKTSQKKRMEEEKTNTKVKKTEEQETVSMNTPLQSPILTQQPQKATIRGEYNSRKKKKNCRLQQGRLSSVVINIETQLKHFRYLKI